VNKLNYIEFNTGVCHQLCTLIREEQNQTLIITIVNRTKEQNVTLQIATC